MKKKTWAIVLSVVLVLALAITGTVAYLTDRDSATNVFTWGNVSIKLNEDFEQGANLVPGKDIEKDVTVSNTGNTDAWVWVKIAFPAALDNDDASQNIVHFNYAKESVGEGLWTWMNEQNAWNVEKDVTINEEQYNVYTVMYQTALKPGETTAYSAMTKVYMDTAVDIDPDGNVCKIVNGVASNPVWNINTDGVPMIYISAYATQAEGFATVAEAYAAYDTQWGVNGTEWGTPAKVVEVSDLDALKDALNSEDPVIVDAGNGDLGDMDDTTFKDGTVIRNATFTGDANLGSYGNNAYGTVTFINCTFTSEYAYAAHFDGGNGELVFIDCDFEGWNSFGTAITGLTFKNCTFGHNGYYGIARVYQDATFTECTFASDFEGVDTNVEGTVVHFNNCTGISADNIYNNTDSKGVVSRGVWYIDGVDVSDQIKAW